MRTFFLSKNLIVFIILMFLGSCSKKDQGPAGSDAGILNFSLFPGKDVTTIDIPGHQVIVRVPDSVSSGKALVAQFSTSPGAVATVNSVTQLSGTTENDFEDDVSYTVTASDKMTKQVWYVRAANNDYSIPWGLGHFIHREVSNNKAYNWYIDQGTSGDYALVNCGPASVTMAIKWADSSFSKTALQARQTYHPEGGWWFTTDIDNYLSNNNTTHAIISLNINADSTRDLIIRQLDHQQIIILCLDMDYVRLTGRDDYRVDKFYQTSPGWGHFIVLKGYRKIDGKTYFEAYDPYSFGFSNTDHSLKGQNRYYRYEDLAAACLPWWNFAFVIARKGESLNTETIRKKLNPAFVPVAHNF
jgi:hypothetical protein